jgi:hypothetical protein
MKPRHLVLGAALLGAVLLVVFGDRAPETVVAEAVERPAAVLRPVPAAAAVAMVPPATPGAVNIRPGASRGKEQPILALVPREILIGDSDGRFGQGENGAGANLIFGRRDWNPPPPPPQPAPPPPPPPPPTAPPLPFTFIGKSVGAGAWEVYLARGDRTYVVRADTVIDGMYRVDAIAPPVLTLTYLPLNQVQQLNIGVFE